MKTVGSTRKVSLAQPRWFQMGLFRQLQTPEDSSAERAWTSRKPVQAQHCNAPHLRAPGTNQSTLASVSEPTLIPGRWWYEKYKEAATKEC